MQSQIVSAHALRLLRRRRQQQQKQQEEHQEKKRVVTEASADRDKLTSTTSSASKCSKYREKDKDELYSIVRDSYLSHHPGSVIDRSGDVDPTIAAANAHVPFFLQWATFAPRRPRSSPGATAALPPHLAALVAGAGAGAAVDECSPTSQRACSLSEQQGQWWRVKSAPPVHTGSVRVLMGSQALYADELVAQLLHWALPSLRIEDWLLVDTPALRANLPSAQQHEQQQQQEEERKEEVDCKKQQHYVSRLMHQRQYAVTLSPEEYCTLFPTQQSKRPSTVGAAGAAGVAGTAGSHAPSLLVLSVLDCADTRQHDGMLEWSASSQACFCAVLRATQPSAVLFLSGEVVDLTRLAPCIVVPDVPDVRGVNDAWVSDRRGEEGSTATIPPINCYSL